VLTRDNIRSGLIRDMIRQADPTMRVLTDEELHASIAAVITPDLAGRDVWLFCYGSLIWNPAFHFVERRLGTVHGYHRRFCLWTHLGRGTPDFPGLVLGLERGGSCRGVAFRVAAEAVPDELEIVWRREMVSGAYRPTWVTVRTPEGPVRAVTFVMNRRHDRYAGLLPEDRVADVIANAAGYLGRCADYLINTVAHLEELGIHDRALVRLRDRVAEGRAEGPVREGRAVPITPPPSREAP
jgi:glutathione-specific gamma-glutamylcyclotransferase